MYDVCRCMYVYKYFTQFTQSQPLLNMEIRHLLEIFANVGWLLASTHSRSGTRHKTTWGHNPT